MLKRINLVPAPPVKYIIKKWANVGASLMVILMVLIPGLRYWQLNQNIARAARVKEQLTEDARKAEQIQIMALKLKKEVDDLDREIKGLQREILELSKKKRFIPPYREALLQITRAMTPNVRLSRVQLFNMKGTINGEARNVMAIPLFIEALESGGGPITRAELAEVHKGKDDMAMLYDFVVNVDMKRAGKNMHGGQNGRGG